MKYDVHGVDKRLERALRLVREDESVLPKNRETILRFERYALSIGLKQERRYKYLNLLRWLSKALYKPFEEGTKEDFILIIGELEKTKLTEWSKVDRKVTIKRFYKWLNGNDEVYPDKVRWIKCRMKNDRCKMPEELITEEEVGRMAAAATRPRDKALVLCLYESGCRISELLTLQNKNVVFDNLGAVLRVTGKTGDRRVRIVASSSALASWMDFHPYKDDPEAYVWTRNLHRGYGDKLPCRYTNAANIIKRLAKRAGIKKRVNPHNFRHSRATALANKLTEAQMKAYFGWVQGSDMASVYVHLSGRDVDNAILDAYGMKKESQESGSFRPHDCGRCGARGSPGSKFCTRCGCALSVEAVLNGEEPEKKDNLMAMLMKDPEFKELLLKKALAQDERHRQGYKV